MAHPDRASRAGTLQDPHRYRGGKACRRVVVPFRHDGTAQAAPECVGASLQLVGLAWQVADPPGMSENALRNHLSVIYGML